MDQLKIEGGVPLNGSVVIAGAKNAALPILAAALLTDEEVQISNVPQLADIATMLKLLRGMGVAVQREGDTVTLRAQTLTATEAPYALVKTMRAAVLVLGPLVTRFKHARVSLPGGCAIGARPVDQHIAGLARMGVHVRIDGGYMVVTEQDCPKRLKGARIVTDMVTVTGTENLMMAAALAEGETVIENAAREPEVVDLAQCLIAMGARIKGAGTDRIVIEGVPKLHGVRYAVMPDRIETGTFAVAAAVGGAFGASDVWLQNAAPHTLDAVLDKLLEAGAQIDVTENSVRVRAQARPKAVSLRTAPYPAFPTDMQAQFMAMDCMAQGVGRITETIFENRFMHVLELQRLCAHIAIEGHTAVVEGSTELVGAPVMATDLRASASLVIAGLAAQGVTVVDRIYHLDRGYEKMEAKLAALGARVQRVAASN